MPKPKPKPLSARETFARNLRRVRRLKDMTQEQLALEAEVPRAYLSRVERGTINLSMDNAERLARAVGVQLKDLVDPAKFADVEES